jgi:hypothetical protein
MEGMLANLHLSMGQSQEANASSPGLRAIAEGGLLLSLAAATFGKLKAEGRLSEDGTEAARQADRALVRCTRISAADGGGR